MTEQSPPPIQAPEGWLASILNYIKHLTFTNVVIIVILIIIIVPTYFIYRVLNDEVMLYRFLSSYKEIPNPVPGSNCTLREISIRGAGDTYGIATSFASLGTDRWQIGVILNHSPSPQDIKTYCETLNLIVDKMRDPTKPDPMYPGTNEPLIWPYPEDGQ